MSREWGSRRAIVDFAPGWLVEVVRPAPATPQWGRMTLCLIAVVTPLAVAVAAGRLIDGTLPAMGALTAVAADQGGSYRARSLRFAVVAVAGAAGFLAGGYIRGSGWWTVLAITALSLVAALLSGAGGTGSVAGLNLLVTSIVATGMPLAGAPWHNAVMFVAGACWTILLVAVVWPLHPTLPEREGVAATYRALADFLRTPNAATTAVFARARRTAYESVLAARSWSPGSQRERTKLVALLNQSSVVRDAGVALDLESIDAAPRSARYAEEVAAAILGESRTYAAMPDVDSGATPARRALRSALAGAMELVDTTYLSDEVQSSTGARPRRPVRSVLAEMWTGRLLRLFALRLAVCMAVAGAVSELFPLQRSYWVMLTVAVVLKPDFGSVFARALQRGLGTTVGAVIGAALLAIASDGPWLLIPIAVLAFAMPYGKRRNWGLFSTFQTPLVILFIDLPAHIGWKLAEIRLADAVVGCAIVLILGYLPWPGSWQAPVRPRLADALDAIAEYFGGAFGAAEANLPQLRRAAYDRLADLRTSFQRAIAEPAAVSRRTLAWWPAVIAAERALDVATATVARTAHGAAPPDAAGLAETVHAMAEDIRAGRPIREVPEPPDEQSRPLSDAVRGVRHALSGEAR
ncbi:FUSC family protein [Nocardia macrotermitis]|uniref:Integral membrane bound transporter domain-containing protein n=1 Tax=Nocardia macrotermitis TaxID=2585198 RepID=A0A7K0CU81_9NOCA|nr:FUSC family protein [Nocardia macrotermitis]MQY17030.1 hypothetical protein [Nocardia macrotermitis]